MKEVYSVIIYELVIHTFPNQPRRVLFPKLFPILNAYAQKQESKTIETVEVGQRIIERELGIWEQSSQTQHKLKRQSSPLVSAENKSKVPKLERQDELMEIDDYDWKNIHPSFTNELIQSWQRLCFTYRQTKDWINAGLKPNDAFFCAWLRDTKQLTPEQVLNHCNLEQLNQEFFNWQQEQQQTQIQIPPK